MRVSGVSPPIQLTGFNNDLNTLERAVKERVFYVKDAGRFVEPPRPVPQHFGRTLSGVFDQLKRHLPRVAPLTRAGFVATFRGRKRRVYELANESLLRSKVSRRDAEVKVFVKYEKTDFTSKTDPVPRVISPRDPRYNVEVGRFLRPVEERIFKSLAALYGDRTVFKGMNSLESGRCMHRKWDEFRKPVAVGLDAMRFDQHVSGDALEWEHSVYNECFRWEHHRRQLGELLRWQRHNVCRGYTEDGKLKYEVEGGRMSGDMNTSLGNCVLMCSMIRAYADSRRVRVLLANNGDDCVVFMEADDLARFSEGLDGWFHAMGFSMAVEPPCYTFEELEFCQTHPVWVGPGVHDYLMIRHPKRAIAKDSVCVHPWQTEDMFRGWMHAVGVGGLAMTGGVPVFQDFYRQYVRFGKHKSTAVSLQSWGVRQLEQGMVREYGCVLPATRASFYWAFGVTPDEQLCLEDFYGGVRYDAKLRDELAYQPDMPL